MQQPLDLSSSQLDCLRIIARHMIPACEEFGMPGADDPAVVAEMVRSLGRDRSELCRVLDLVAPSRSLSRAHQASHLARLRLSDPAGFSVVEAVVSRAYYRDDRVLKSIGMDARPPFPQGYEVEQGDWSLLDPVRSRGIMYRDAGI
jgi:hypothetical protein